MSPLTGRSLQQGKYIVDQELGRGGFGITYKARNTALAQSVVIKTINDGLRQDPQFQQHQRQFQDEARRLAKCFHPNIVRVVDFFIEDGLPHIVMDYIPGQTLDTLVQPGRPLPEATALHYIRQVGEAVEAIHRAGLLHRDLKPQNMIVQPETQQVILIDFGIAREFTPGVTQVHTHIVSEGYAPIEQYLKQAQRSPATDIYGLAATLYTLLTGQVPAAAILRDRAPLQAPHEIQPTVSRSVSAAVMRGMAVEPQDRPQQMRDWLALLSPASSRHSGAASAPVSKVPTVVVAPQYRPRAQADRGAATAPATRIAPGTAVKDTPPSPPGGRASQGWWLPGAIALSVFLPFMLGYAWWRNQMPNQTSPAPTPTPEAVTTPFPDADATPIEEPESEAIRPARDSEPTPLPEEETPADAPPVEAEAPTEPAPAEAPTAPTEPTTAPAEPVGAGSQAPAPPSPPAPLSSPSPSDPPSPPDLPPPIEEAPPVPEAGQGESRQQGQAPQEGTGEIRQERTAEEVKPGNEPKQMQRNE
ncbi:MAG TPA: protein kinase [Trichocoleus sp.]